VWTTLESAEILRLRHLKQLIRLAADLREDLGDKESAATVSSWLRVTAPVQLEAAKAMAPARDSTVDDLGSLTRGT
jgi:hypothetical protein